MGRTSDARERILEAALLCLWTAGYAGTSIDDICARAGVRKGSFYHFFASKEELARAALEAHWAALRAALDRIFSPTVPPLERLRGAFAASVERQAALQASTGAVLGCPLYSLGAEIGAREPGLMSAIRGMLDGYVSYYESAIRDAAARGEIQAPDPAAKARSLMALVEGTLTEARIRNDLGPVERLAGVAFAWLGVPEPVGSVARS